MKKYVIFKREGSTNKKFVYYIQRNSISTSNDLGDAIEFDNEEQATSMKEYLSSRENDKLYILCIETNMTVLGEENGERD